MEDSEMMDLDSSFQDQLNSSLLSYRESTWSQQNENDDFELMKSIIHAKTVAERKRLVERLENQIREQKEKERKLEEELELQKAQGEKISQQFYSEKRLYEKLLYQTLDYRQKLNYQVNGVIVLDTNILLSYLQSVAFLKEALKPFSIILCIPWIVVRELDGLKNEKKKTGQLDKNGKLVTVEYLARNAINWIQECLKNNDFGLRGQQLSETLNTKTNGNDDLILDCCLYFRQFTRVLLVSNDHNLAVKSLVHQILCFNWNDLPRDQTLLHCLAAQPIYGDVSNIINSQESGSNEQSDISMEDDLECYNFKKEIDNSKRTTPINQIHNENERQNQNQYQNQEIENSLPPLKFPKISPELKKDEVIDSVREMLDLYIPNTIEKTFEKIYGDDWKYLVSIPPPWNTFDLFQILKKHWLAVFSSILPRNSQQSINFGLDFLKKNTKINFEPSFQDLTSFVEVSFLILSLCPPVAKFYQKDFEDYIKKLKNLK